MIRIIAFWKSRFRDFTVRELSVSIIKQIEVVNIEAIKKKYCEAQGKGRVKGRPRKVAQRLFIQGGPTKRVISKNLAITTLKSIRKGKSWCVLENSA